MKIKYARDDDARPDDTGTPLGNVEQFPRYFMDTCTFIILIHIEYSILLARRPKLALLKVQDDAYYLPIRPQGYGVCARTTQP
jgi:hypothetical protein